MVNLASAIFEAQQNQKPHEKLRIDLTGGDSVFLDEYVAQYIAKDIAARERDGIATRMPEWLADLFPENSVPIADDISPTGDGNPSSAGADTPPASHTKENTAAPPTVDAAPSQEPSSKNRALRGFAGFTAMAAGTALLMNGRETPADDAAAQEGQGTLPLDASHPRRGLQMLATAVGVGTILVGALAGISAYRGGSFKQGYNAEGATGLTKIFESLKSGLNVGGYANQAGAGRA